MCTCISRTLSVRQVDRQLAALPMPVGRELISNTPLECTQRTVAGSSKEGRATALHTSIRKAVSTAEPLTTLQAPLFRFINKTRTGNAQSGELPENSLANTHGTPYKSPESTATHGTTLTSVQQPPHSSPPQNQQPEVPPNDKVKIQRAENNATTPEKPQKPPLVACIVAHVDHGKTTIMDSIIAAEGRLSRTLAGAIRYLDSRDDEQQRAITLKLSPVQLRSGRVLIDTPGHIDFEPLLLSAALLSDSHIIVVDVNEGVTPRMRSLLCHVHRDRCILVLNKIDKCESAEAARLVICQVNGLLGAEAFAWERGNVVLSDALHCCGVCAATFHLSNKNTLRAAFSAYTAICELCTRAESPADDEARQRLAALLARHGAPPQRGLKAVLSVVMPLAAAIHASLDGLPAACIGALYTPFYEITDNDISGFNNTDLNKDWTSAKSVETRGDLENAPFIGLLGAGIFRNHATCAREDVIFLCRVIRGVVRAGDVMFSVAAEGAAAIDAAASPRRVRVDAVYGFEADTLVRRDSSAGAVLVGVAGDFLRMSVLAAAPCAWRLERMPLALFRANLQLHDAAQLPLMKRTLCTLSLVEQPLHARKNRHGEIVVQCSGHVQFDKICRDLERAGLVFSRAEALGEFREFITVPGEAVHTCETCGFKITLKPFLSLESGGDVPDGVVRANNTVIRDTEDMESGNTVVNMEDASDIHIKAEEMSASAPFTVINEKFKNKIQITGLPAPHALASTLEIFLEAGPFAREHVMHMDISIDMSCVPASDTLFYTVRREITTLYNACAPAVCPRLARVSLSVLPSHLGTAYSVLQRHLALLDGEDFDGAAGFAVIACRLPQMRLASMCDEMRAKTSGTAYVEAGDAGFAPCPGFECLAEALRRDKGLLATSRLVDNPEQQRTLKR